MGHLIPFIFVAIVIASKLFARFGNQSEDLPPPRPGGPARPPAETEEERMRRFMEAVGLPPGTPPPPLVRPRTSAQPPPLHPITPPAIFPVRPPGTLRRVPPATPASPAPAARGIPRAPEPKPAPPVVPQPAAPVRAALVSAIPGAPPDGALPVKTPGSANAAIAASAAPAKPAAIPASALLLRLRDPASLREAVILREVLGPPRAFEPLRGWA